MKKDILFTVSSYFRDDMNIMAYRFGKGEKTCAVVGALRGDEVQQLYVCARLVSFLREVEKAGGIDFSMPLALGYTGLSDAVLKKYIEDSAALWAGHTEGELPVHTIGATIGTHVGPGAVAVAFFQPAN